MRIGILFIIAALLFASTQANDHDYPPSINFMMRNILIDKFREIIVPQVMEQFKTIKPDDIREKHWYFEFALYDMIATIIPLTPDQLEITTHEETNSLYFKITGFQMEFSALAYCRILFFHFHGSGDISMKVDTFEFEFSPGIYEDGVFNDLTYDILKLNIVVKADDINIEHLTIGILPNWIAKPAANAAIHHCQGAIDAFSTKIGNKIKDILAEHRKDIPDQVEIPDTTLSASCSFPSVPKFFNERIEIPFDGTVFITKDGYDPQKQHAETPMPTFNESDPNNVQFFIHQHMLKVDFETVKKAGLKIDLDKDSVAKFDLPDDVFTVKYFQMLFPFMSCAYDSSLPIRIELGLDTKLDTDVTFVEGGMTGKISPSFKIFVKDELAITVMFTAEFGAQIDFRVQDKGSYAHGVLNTVKLTKVGYEKGTVLECDLPQIVEHFEEKTEMLFKKGTDSILDTGVYIPAFPLFNGLFSIDLEMIFMEFKDTYMYTSFTLDIHEYIEMLKALRLNKNLFKKTTTLQQLLKPVSETCHKFD